MGTDEGYATEQDLRRTEERGCLAGADPSQVSKRAKNGAERNWAR
jgi:RNA-splicing ligase RtcB